MHMLRTVPYIRAIRRLINGRGSLASVSRNVEILCQVETEELPPPLMLPGQLERITDRQADPRFDTTNEHEILTATRPTITHAPTIAYHLDRAALISGSIYIKHYRHIVSDKPSQQAPVHISEAQLSTSWLGSQFFGHWLRDDLTVGLLGPTPLSVPGQHYPDADDYLKYFGQKPTAPVDKAMIDHLTIYQDFSQNSLKRKRYDKLRAKMSEQFPKEPRDCIYLRRGNTGSPRLIENEDEIIDRLSKAGFTIIDQNALGDKLARLSKARVVVTMEGSQLNHCVYTLPESAAVIALEPSNRFCSISRGWCNCLGIQFGFVVGHKGQRGYLFSADEVLRTVDLVKR
jgi:capsular polysaccharide biosynthesis protein